MRRTEVLIPAATGRTYGGQSSRKQKAVDFVGFHLCEIPGLGKSTETKQIRGCQGLLAVYGVPFWGEEKVSKLEGTVAQHCECTIHFLLADFMFCESYS